MNPLLNRQIRKYLPEKLQSQEEVQQFLKAIEDSYNNFDEQFKMTQRAMKISSDELFAANKSLRQETEQQQALLNRLEEVVIMAQPFQDAELNTKGKNILEGTNLADYISAQAEQLIKVNKNQELLLDELAIQNQELNDYAHIVSHDLKSPLRSIEALVSWLKEDYEEVLGEDGKSQIELIVSNLEKMDALISGILSYSSIDKEIRTERRIDLTELINDTIDLLHVPSHIKIIIHELPQIIADRFKIQQLFQNLIGNAVTNMDKPEGEIHIIASVVKNCNLFEIKDNGKGINANYFEKIFQVFQKLNNDTQSSGIGLSIVKKIVNFYGGEIWLESKEGIGTSFFFTLPKTK